MKPRLNIVYDSFGNKCVVVGDLIAQDDLFVKIKDKTNQVIWIAKKSILELTELTDGEYNK